MSGWRTLTIRNFEELALRGDSLLVAAERPVTVPLSQLREIIVDAPVGSITLPLILALAENHVNLIFCDRKHLPGCFLAGAGMHTETAGCQMDQAAWREEKRDIAWQKIIRNKISMQMQLLALLDLEDDGQIYGYLEEVLPGDPTNREGQAARIYFDRLFGREFIRHGGGDENAALNYGYAILLSMTARVIAAFGYSTAIGFHHCSRENAMNLACDLMEPFRPLVDETVYYNYGRPLDTEYKKELISLTQRSCRYKGQCVRMDSAIGMLALDTFGLLNGEKDGIGEVSFDYR